MAYQSGNFLIFTSGYLRMVLYFHPLAGGRGLFSPRPEAGKTLDGWVGVIGWGRLAGGSGGIRISTPRPENNP